MTLQLLNLIEWFKHKKLNASSSGQNYGRSSVMTNQISNLTKQSFPEICRNDQSLNETSVKTPSLKTPSGLQLYSKETPTQVFSND